MYQVGKAGLWRPPDLQLALNWQAKHKPTLVWGQRYNPAFERTIIFLEYSKKEFDTEQRIKELEQKRKLQTARTTAIVFGVLMVIAILFLVYAFVQRAEAQKQERAANDNLILANKNAKDAEDKRIEAEKATKKAEEERLRAEEEKKRAEEESIRANQNAELAKKNAAIANINAEKARLEALRADENAKDAIEKKNEAIAAKAEADKRRYLSIAKSMALKSKQLSDAEQQALLAQQAYNFNKKYDGYEYDDDIYNGLFAALEKYNHPLTLSLAGHDKAARSIVTSVKNSSIYSGGSDGKVFHWTREAGIWKGKLIRQFTDYQIYSMNISPDGNILAIGGLYPADRNANYAMLINLDNMSGEPKRIPGFRADIENISFTPDSKGFYARNNSGKSIMFSDLTSAKEVITSKEKITSIDLSPDGSKLAGVGEDGNLYIWDVRKNYAATTYSILKGTSNDLLAVAFTPAGNEVVVGDQNGELRIVNNGLTRRVLSGHTSQIEQIKFSHSGKFMATSSFDRTLRLWNMDKLKEQPQVMSNNDWVWSMSFSPDDEQIMAGMHSVTEGARDIDTDFTIHAFPTKIPTMAGELCGKVKRNMSKDEWDLFVAEDLPREVTCTNLPANNK